MRVALTGGIASGKSVVGRVLRSEGLATVDADQLAREAVGRETAGLDAVVTRFGRELLTAGGELDRAALGRLVFADAGARRELEALLHPIVRAGMERFYAQLPPGAIGVAEIPLVYETGWVRNVDVVVVAACRRATQRDRLIRRDRLSAQEAEQRLAAQWPIEDKARLADAVVVTEGPMASTLKQASRCATWLRDRTSLS